VIPVTYELAAIHVVTNAKMYNNVCKLTSAVKEIGTGATELWSEEALRQRVTELSFAQAKIGG
jgi:hypothetical protein